MTLDQIKASHEKHRLGKEQCLALMQQLQAQYERARLDMLANDGAMQGMALLIAEEEAELAKQPAPETPC